MFLALYFFKSYDLISFSLLSLINSLNMLLRLSSFEFIFSKSSDFSFYKLFIFWSSMYRKFSRLICSSFAALQVSSLLSMTCNLSSNWCYIFNISSSFLRFWYLIVLCFLNNSSNYFNCCSSSCFKSSYSFTSFWFSLSSF